MKRVIYIAFVVVGLLAVSCSKETIRPVSTENEEIPTWKSTSSNPGNENVPSGPGTITDPNNDEDSGKRKRH